VPTSQPSAPELTVREAAGRVGRSEETVRRWIWSGRLPAYKRGNVLRIRTADLDDVAPVPAGAARGAAGGIELREWAAEVDRWRAGLGADTRPTAADLVLESRAARAGG
jgi:excisionase family DNA binding protein